MPTPDIKTIFVPLTVGEESRSSAAFDYAASMASGLAAHLTIRAFGVKIESPYSFAPAFVGSLVNPANARHQTELDAATGRLGRALPEGVAADLKAAFLGQDDILRSAAHQARLHDLSIVDSPRDYFAVGRALVEELLFHTGRPVIVAPPEAGPFRADRILVAWDGSASAARALGDAMPILKAAVHVAIASAPGDKDLSKVPAGAEVAPMLARHGIRAEAVELDASGDAGKALIDHAALIGADMIVMGAFAHARWRQFVLGGVTESMLRGAPLPVFMSH